MKDYRATFVTPTTSIIDAVAAINRSAVQIANVVDADDRLLGTVTDGDVRRGLLAGVRLSDTVETVMNRNPVTAPAGGNRMKLLAMMRRRSVNQVPLLDTQGRVVGLETLASVLEPGGAENWVILMAGGLGTRLRPLTHTLPKPLLPVGGKPIVEWTISALAAQGFHRFLLCLNYKAELFRSYFGDGERLNVHIQYLEEQDQLGTAGALSLLPFRPTAPFVIMNGDVLTAVNLHQLLEFHTRTEAEATLCVSEHSVQIPYGVASVDGTRLVELKEKPSHTFLVNAGIYAASPSFLDLVPAGQKTDMPDLLQGMMRDGRRVSAFPLHEYWRDIGRLEDLSNAEQDLPALCL